MRASAPPAIATDRAFVVVAAVAAMVALVAFGMASAIIPNPVFGRQMPPTAAAIAIWLASAPPIGLIAATYLVRPPARLTALPLPASNPMPVERPAGEGLERTGTLLGSAGSIAAFLAIGCPVCNKVALLLLGTSGALTIWAPLQPVVGAASVTMLIGTAAWRVRGWARGDACATRPTL